MPGWQQAMDLGSLIETHGYWMVAVGALLEGETVLVLAGFAAHRGYLDLGGVVATAAVAGFLGDQLFFWLGRRHGPAVLARWPSVARRSARIHDLVQRRGAVFVVGVRFAYGLRVAGPVLIGTSSIPALRFAALNAVGALAWAALLACLGWLFGQAAEAALGQIRHVEGWLFLGLCAVGLATWWARRC